jgi:soluble P-type ATPase
MIRLDIPGRAVIELHHAVFDINGTLAIDGKLIPEVIDRLQELSTHLSLHALTAGTHGNMTEIGHLLGFPLHLVMRNAIKLANKQKKTTRANIAYILHLL